MNDLAVFVLLFIAVATGWWLGRSGSGRQGASVVPSGRTFRGLNYLLDDRDGGAVDAVVEALAVTPETLETHLALGNLLRGKGETERAIRVHQNLLAHPGLPRDALQQAHLELARDFISAGLLDRAERLLQDLADEDSRYRSAARRHLLELYQDQREWGQAARVAEAMLGERLTRGGLADSGSASGQSVAVSLSHFRCELAAERIQAGEYAAARKLLQHTLEHDPQCARASLMLAEVEYISGHYRRAIKVIQRLREQAPAYIPEAVTTLRQCHRELGSGQELQSWLVQCLEEASSPALLLAVADELQRNGGAAVAADFLAERLQREPSLRGLEQLLSLRAGQAEDEVRRDLELLQALVQRLLRERPAYRCGHCGFAGRELHWLCPGCKYWGTMTPVRGIHLD